MGYAPSRKEVKRILSKLRDKVEREECFSCDCLHALLMQLQLDVDEDMGDLFDSFAVPRDMMHACLGCTPCIPSQLYSDYIRKQESGRHQSRQTGSLASSV